MSWSLPPRCRNQGTTPSGGGGGKRTSPVLGSYSLFSRRPRPFYAQSFPDTAKRKRNKVCPDLGNWGPELAQGNTHSSWGPRLGLQVLNSFLFWLSDPLWSGACYLVAEMSWSCLLSHRRCESLGTQRSSSSKWPAPRSLL